MIVIRPLSLACALALVAGAAAAQDRVALPVPNPAGVTPYAPAPLVFRDDGHHRRPAGYNIPTVVPGVVPAGSIVHIAPGSGGVTATPVVSTHGNRRSAQSGASAAASGVIQTAPMIADSAPISAARPTVTAVPVVAQGPNGTPIRLEVSVAPAATSARAPETGINAAPLVSKVWMPTVVMTQRVVMPAQRP